MTCYRLSLLGQPLLIGPEGPMLLKPTRSNLLLCYLAVQPHRLVPRSELITLLWEHFDDGRHILSTTLTRLRRSLPTWPLQSKGDAIGWAGEAGLDVDTALFQTWSACLRQPGAEAALSKEQLLRVGDAIALWRGPFLDGFSAQGNEEFDEWCAQERRYWERVFLQVLGRLSTLESQAGNWAGLLKHCQLAIRINPYEERFYRELMQAYCRLGEREEALSWYRTLAHRLSADLGSQPEPETRRLWDQITAAPPITAPVRRASVLPAALTSFIGREAEAETIRQLLRDGRMVTILGPGGVGKTRLALHVAQEWKDRCAPIALRSASDHVSLVAELIGQLGLSTSTWQDPIAELRAHLSERAHLLVLDNVEQVTTEAAELVLLLLEAAPELRVLVTSRERLHIPGEQVILLSGLPVPESTKGAVQQAPAFQLFTDRARAANPSFELTADAIPAIMQICQLTEGFPLAIELAASWVRLFTCQEIAADLRASFEGPAPIRQTTSGPLSAMRFTFETSWRLLSEVEHQVFQRLSVFRGPFPRQAAEAVAGATAPVLAALLDKSLVRRPASGRFELHELLRQYGAEKLGESPAEEEAAREAHCDYYATMMQERAEMLTGLGQVKVLSEIYAALANVQAGWQWAVERGTLVIERYMEALYRFFEVRGLLREGETAFAQAAAAVCTRATLAPEDAKLQLVLAQLLTRQSNLASRLGKNAEALRSAQEALAIVRRFGERVELPFFLSTLGDVHARMFQFDEAKPLYREALTLCREGAWNALEVARALNNLGRVAQFEGDYVEAGRLYQESLTVSRMMGNQWGYLITIINLGNLALLTGQNQTARDYFEQGLRGVLEAHAYVFACGALVGLATLMSEAEPEQAAELCAFVICDPASEQEYTDQAEQLLVALAERLPGPVLLDARTRGEMRRLPELGEMLLRGPGSR